MEEKKKNLKNVYDTINKIARKREAEGKDCSHWFYTSKQVEELKKKYKFI